MMPPAFQALEAQLLVWMLASIRPAAAFLAAPIFGSPAVPVPLRLVVAFAVGLPAVSLGQIAVPEQGMISVAGTLLVASEVLIGLALGFVVQLGFAAAAIGGEVVSNTMGLGFASMLDPVSGMPSPAIGQLLSMLATLLFLTMGGHLLLAEMVVSSFAALPPGPATFAMGSAGAIAEAGGLAFAGGIAVALPVGIAMTLVQIVLAMVSRSAPTLNLFAIGVPATVLAGIVVLAVSLPAMVDALEDSLTAGLALSAKLASGS